MEKKTESSPWWYFISISSHAPAKSHYP